MTSTFRGAFLAAALAAVVLLAAPGALAQGTPAVSVSPSSGPAGSKFEITLSNYRACTADQPNCIVIDFVQGSVTTNIGTADSRGQATFKGNLTVPPACTATVKTRCTNVGAAKIRAHIDGPTNPADASADFMVSSTAATTTSSSTTTSSTTTSTSTTTSSTTSTTATTVPATTTTTTAKTKKTSSHSDVPRYIAVALVVLAAAATAAVDTRLRRMAR